MISNTDNFKQNTFLKRGVLYFAKNECIFFEYVFPFNTFHKTNYIPKKFELLINFILSPCSKRKKTQIRVILVAQRPPLSPLRRRISHPMGRLTTMVNPALIRHRAATAMPTITAPAPAATVSMSPTRIRVVLVISTVVAAAAHRLQLPQLPRKWPARDRR